MSRISEELRSRTKAFASSVIRLYAALPKRRREVEVVGYQLLRSGTSTAANIREASRARSDNEFISKIEIVIQEADESHLWLELLEEDCGIRNESTTQMLKEVDELIAILVTIVSRSKRNRP